MKMEHQNQTWGAQQTKDRALQRISSAWKLQQDA